MFYLTFQKLPVTAIAIHNNVLVAAQGGYIDVYDISFNNHKILNHLQIFKQSVIHGLKFHEYNQKYHLVIFGGKELCIVLIDFIETKTGKNVICKVLHSKLFLDWIHDVVILKNRNTAHYQFGLALAHNSVIEYDWNENNIVDEVHCPDKCILYAAHFVQSDGVSWSDLCLFSGTVFNQVIIWKPCLKQLNQSCIIKRLNGHDGVIFDLQFNLDYQILMTASDDRSIRVWDCSFLTANTSCDSSDSCLCVLYGHEARIWKVDLFVKDELYIISVAEDGFCILWKLSDFPSRFSASIIRKLNFRANLLSLFVSKADDRFAAGGCDGSIRLCSFSQSLKTYNCQETDPVDKDKYGVLKSITLLTENCMAVLAHTDKGVMLLFDIKSRKWRVLVDDDNFGSYAILKVNKSETFAAIGNTKGLLKIFKLDLSCQSEKSIKLQPFQSKILSIIWCENNVFVTGPNGIISRYKISSTFEKQFRVDLISNFLLPNAKHRWATAIFLLPSLPDGFLCGDRRGSVHYYVKGSSHPRRTYHGAHGKLGVTSLVNYGSNVISTGRDGHWRIWSLQNGYLILFSKHRAAQDYDRTVKLRATFNRLTGLAVGDTSILLTFDAKWLNSSLMPGMEWLEGCDFVDQKYLYLHGFHGNKFVVWSKFSGDEIFSILCGGGHRSWGFSIRAACFAFLKAGRLNIAKVGCLTDQKSVVSSLFHSQHINCVRHLFTFQSQDEVVRFIATSGEDTKVFLSSLLENSSRAKESHKLRVRHILDDHLSNVRCIASGLISSRDDVTELLMGVGGGRALLNFYRITIFHENSPGNMTVEFLTSYTCDVLESEVRLMSMELWREGCSVIVKNTL